MPDTMTATQAREAMAYEVSEKTLQETIIRMARNLDWMCYHTFDSRRSEKGFPDLTLVHPEHGVVWMELKVQNERKGKVRPEQERWMNTLHAAGQRVYLIRPLDMDFVESVLRGHVLPHAARPAVAEGQGS